MNPSPVKVALLAAKKWVIFRYLSDRIYWAIPGSLQNAEIKESNEDRCMLYSSGSIALKYKSTSVSLKSAVDR